MSAFPVSVWHSREKLCQTRERCKGIAIYAIALEYLAANKRMTVMKDKRSVNEPLGTIPAEFWGMPGSGEFCVSSNLIFSRIEVNRGSVGRI